MLRGQVLDVLEDAVERLDLTQASTEVLESALVSLSDAFSDPAEVPNDQRERLAALIELLAGAVAAGSAKAIDSGGGMTASGELQFGSTDEISLDLYAGLLAIRAITRDSRELFTFASATTGLAAALQNATFNRPAARSYGIEQQRNRTDRATRSLSAALGAGLVPGEAEVRAQIPRLASLTIQRISTMAAAGSLEQEAQAEVPLLQLPRGGLL